jgi:hypothetical protein
MSLVRRNGVIKKRDLAAEFVEKPTPPPSPNFIAHQFKKGDWDERNLARDPVTGRLLPKDRAPKDEGGLDAPVVPKKKVERPRNVNADSVKAIKEYMVELLNDEAYRRGLTRRIKGGELPQIELFLLQKAIGKPKEEVEITANVPLFSLPTTFLLKEDDVEAEDVKVLEAGDENGANQVRE